MANYTLGVVGHVERSEQIARLTDQLSPDIIEVDDGSLGVAGNHALVLGLSYRNARRCGQEWVVVLEDDVLPVVGFHHQASAALDVAPSLIVSLYSGTGHPANFQAGFAELSKREDVCWILHRNMRHAIAYALHTSMFEYGVIETMTEAARTKWAPDDALSRFARKTRIEVCSSNPSLVDHEDGPTVIKGRTSMGMAMNARRRPRKAHWCGTRMRWSDTSIHIDNGGQT